MESQKDVDGASCPSRCSVALVVPEIPTEAFDFASEVGSLCDKYNIRSLSMDVRLDKWTSDHKYRPQIATDIKVFVSTKDGRGRPCKNVALQANVSVTAQIETNPESSN